MEKRKKASNWLYKEVISLLDVMIEKHVMKLFDDKKTRSNDIYKMVSTELKKQGFNRDEEQIKYKFVKLKTEYMKQVNNNKKSGHSREDDEFYDKMSQLLQTRPATAFRNNGFDSSSVHEQSTSTLNDSSNDDNHNDDEIIEMNTSRSSASVFNGIPPPTKKQRTSYSAVVTSLTADLKKTFSEETKKTIDALEKLQEDDKKWQKEMQKNDQDFLRELFNSFSGTSQNNVGVPFYFVRQD